MNVRTKGKDAQKRGQGASQPAPQGGSSLPKNAAARLDEALSKQDLNQFFEKGKEAAVVHPNAASEKGEHARYGGEGLKVKQREGTTTKGRKGGTESTVK